MLRSCCCTEDWILLDYVSYINGECVCCVASAGSETITNWLLTWLCSSRKEVPPEEDHGEEAAHQTDHRQAAAVRHLEDRKWVLWVCTGTVSVCASSRCQREGRRTVRPGSELLLREDLPQSELSMEPEQLCTTPSEVFTLVKLGCLFWPGQTAQWTLYERSV